MKTKREEKQRKIEKDLLFKPKISLRKKSPINVSPIKGMERFLTRYRVANKEREGKVAFSQSRDPTNFKSKQKDVNVKKHHLVNKPLYEINQQSELKIPAAEESNEEYDIAREQLHKYLHELH